jgi:hypothetical protein
MHKRAIPANAWVLRKASALSNKNGTNFFRTIGDCVTPLLQFQIEAVVLAASKIVGSPKADDEDQEYPDGKRLD